MQGNMIHSLVVIATNEQWAQRWMARTKKGSENDMLTVEVKSANHDSC